MRLKYKFLLPLVSVLLTISVLFILLFIDNQLEEKRAELYSRAEHTAKLLAYANKFALWNFDGDSLSQTCNAFFENEELIKIVIKDSKGKEHIRLEKTGIKGNEIINREPILFNDNILFNRIIGNVETIHSDYYVNATVSKIAFKFILFSLFFAIILTILVFIIFYIVLRPLKSLTEGLQQISNDNFDIQLSVKSKDEIGELADGLIKTAAKLKESFTQKDQVSKQLLLTNKLLLEEKSNLAKIADTVPGAICMFSRMRNGLESYSYASPFLKEIFGVTPTDLLSDGSLINNIIHPDDYLRMREELDASSDNLSPWLSEFRLAHPEVTVHQHSIFVRSGHLAEPTLARRPA